MLKLTLQYSGHLIQTVDSLERSLMLGKIESKRRRGLDHRSESFREQPGQKGPLSRKEEMVWITFRSLPPSSSPPHPVCLVRPSPTAKTPTCPCSREGHSGGRQHRN